MRIFGKTISEYASFEKVILLLILVVGVARLALSLAGVSNSVAKWASVSVASLIGLVYVSVRVHTSGFGSYKQILPLVYLQTALAHLIVICGILIAILSNKDNIFSAPEYSPAQNGKTLLHVVAHVLAGFVILPLLSWLVGSVILFVTKKVTPGDTDRAAAVEG